MRTFCALLLPLIALIAPPPSPGLIRALNRSRAFPACAFQGDHGSTAAALRKKFAKHPQFDFSTVDDYCKSKGSKWAAGGAEEGKWWHHGHQTKVEAHAVDAQARSAELRTWLAREAVERGAVLVLLVSHGGMLKQTFSTESFANAEFRCFDMTSTGDYKPTFRIR